MRQSSLSGTTLLSLVECLLIGSLVSAECGHRDEHSVVSVSEQCSHSGQVLGLAMHILGPDCRASQSQVTAKEGLGRACTQCWEQAPGRAECACLFSCPCVLFQGESEASGSASLVPRASFPHLHRSPCPRSMCLQIGSLAKHFMGI